ncbi:MAG: metalloregulator ArsR/SmtB family transcription factor [Candidatus Dormibacteria bacterium]
MKADAAIFRALADPTRRQILCELAEGKLAAGEIGSKFEISGPSISRHLAILKNAELVSERREANRIIYSLEPDHLAISMSTFLSTVCPTQMVMRRKITKRATS